MRSRVLNRTRPYLLSLVPVVLIALVVGALLLRQAPAPAPREPEPALVVEPTAPGFSVESRAFTEPFSVALSNPMGTGEIRYTLDGTPPTASSSVYTSPLRVTDTTRLSARVFRAGEEPGPIGRRAWILVDEDVARFRSRLPVLLMETSGTRLPRYRRGAQEPDPHVPVTLLVFEPDADEGSGGTTRMDGAVDFAGRAGIRARGSSTLGREKASLKLEMQDESGEDLKVELLGMPKESDWVLLGPLEFDRALLRNALAYRIAAEMGRYAPRTRFVEVFLNEDGGPMQGPVPDGRDYFGVYLLVEKIKRDPERVAVGRMPAADEPDDPTSGGYILKVDRAGPGDRGFYSGGETYHFVYPKEDEVTTAQADWIERHLDEFHRALYAPEFADASRGYASFLDVDSAIDYHIVNEFTKNPDSYVYSAYFHKPEGGKLTLGPVWDFDRTMGCDHDGRARDPWGPSRNAFRFWYQRLFEDPGFRARYAERWQELRRGPFDAEHLASVIREMAGTIREAAQRNTARWGRWIGLHPGEWEREVDQLEEWVRDRLVWYDQTVPFEERRTYSRRGRRRW